MFDRSSLDRRSFIKVAGTAATAAALPSWAVPRAAATPTPTSAAETAVKALFATLSDAQKKAVCFAWDYQDPKKGLLRTRVENNWQVTKHTIGSDFFQPSQRELIREAYKALLNPEWVARFDKQTKDDNDGEAWGTHQSIAIFGEPGSDKFEFVLTGRHMTLRADGNTGAHVAFGGPIFYGHAADGASEGKDHPGNVFWPQALAANRVYAMLDGKQRTVALVQKRPKEQTVAFRGGKGGYVGLPVGEMSKDQVAELQKVLAILVEPFRIEDREEALECVAKQGGLAKCHLAFYKDGDIGKDEVWDNWRLEGPSFVWYFRGAPHVHVWANVAADPSVATNS